MSETKPVPAPADAAAPAAGPAGPTDPSLSGGSGHPAPPKQPPGEIGGPRGLEPTRFGDWEFKGRCSDF